MTFSHPIRQPRSGAFGIRTGALLGLASVTMSFAEEEKTKSPSPWNLTKIEGSDHVSVEDLRKFYHFDRFQIDESGTATLATPKLEMKIDPDSQWIVLNQIKIKPCLPIQRQDGNAIFVSTVDLTKTIEPSLRPSRIDLDGARPSPISLSITQAPEISATLDSIEPAEDAFGRIHLHLERADDSLSLKSEVLMPPGIGDDGALDKTAKPLPGNESDSLNIALAVACHAHVFRSLGEVEDLGVQRTRDTELADSKIPTFRMSLSVPEDFNDWEGLSQILQKAVERFQGALSD